MKFSNSPRTGILLVSLGLFAVPKISSAQNVLLNLFVPELLIAMGQAITWIAGGIMSIGGRALDAVVENLVVGMGGYVKEIQAIETTWTVFRDFANIFFIFIILYAAIMIIIDTNFRWQRTLGSLIAAAILINFSLFITKAVVDVSNVLSIQFINAIQVEKQLADGTTEIAPLSEIYAQAMRVPSIWGLLDAEKTGANTIEKAVNVLGFSVLAAILAVVVGFVFFAAAFMLIGRFIVLIMVMILSPLAFIGMAVPGLSFQRQWWNRLVNQSFFAPLLFMFFYFSAQVLLDGGFQSALFGSATLAESINIGARTTGQAAGALIGFIIGVGALIYSLIFSKSLGAIGAAGALRRGQRWARGTGQFLAKRGKRAAGAVTFGAAAAVGRQTLGRASNRLAQSNKLRDVAARGGALGGLAKGAINVGKVGAKSTFDARATAPLKNAGLGGPAKRAEDGYAGQRKRYFEKETDFVKDLGNVRYSKADLVKVDKLEQEQKDVSDKLKDERQKLKDYKDAKYDTMPVGTPQRDAYDDARAEIAVLRDELDTKKKDIKAIKNKYGGSTRQKAYVKQLQTKRLGVGKLANFALRRPEGTHRNRVEAAFQARKFIRDEK